MNTDGNKSDREMTPQEKENWRTLQIKVHYCELIQYEIQKLNPDQLYKMLVLVKNTVDEAKPKVLRSPKPSLNRSIFDPNLAKIAREKNYISPAKLLSEVIQLKVELLEFKFTGGYGIFSMEGQSQIYSGENYISQYICFCVPNKLDCMIEICSRNGEKFTYRLTTVEVGQDKKNIVDFFSRSSIMEAVNNVKQKYIENE